MLSIGHNMREVSFCQEKTEEKKVKIPVAVSGVKTSYKRRPFIGDNPLMQRAGKGSRLIIVCGLPGSGKTTLAKVLESRLRAVRFSPDEWMDALSLSLWDEERRAKIEALQWKFAQELLALGLTVIIEWGTWGRAERDTLRLGARALGAAVELHYVSAPADVLFDRIQRRGAEKPPIERDALSRWFEIFQAPTAGEMALFDEPLIADLASD
jgi:predicted kinase